MIMKIYYRNYWKSLLVLPLFLASCQKEPSASFDLSKTNVDVNESIQFTNTTLDGDSYEWEFGDGGTSKAENPSYSYSEPGTYTVTLTAFSKNGKKTNRASAIVKVNEIDPCANITCLNGGYCENGQCICPPGYTGANCGQQVTPSKITISKITVTRFPATDGGAGWDLTSGPDIYVEVLQAGNVIYSHPTFIQNATPGTNYDFNPLPYIEITNPTSQITLRLMDYDDFDADDNMGGLIFTPYNNQGGFPKIINIDAGGDLAFRIEVNYAW